MAVSVNQGAQVVSAVLSTVRYATDGTIVFVYVFTAPSGNAISREVTINVDGSVTDWRGTQIAAPGAATNIRTQLLTQQTNLDTALTGRVISPFA